MKKTLALILIVALFLVSCTPKVSNKPNEVAIKFVETIFNGDISQSKELFSKDAKISNEVINKIKKYKKSNLKAEVIEAKVPKNDGKSVIATVGYEISIKNSATKKKMEIKVPLKVEDGKWVVVIENAK